MSFENLLSRLHECLNIEEAAPETISELLRRVLTKLSESSRLVETNSLNAAGILVFRLGNKAQHVCVPCTSRSNVKRCKERCLEEAVQLLRQTSAAELRALEDEHLLLLVRLLLSLQLEVVCISTACRKVDQVSHMHLLLLLFFI